MTDAQQDALRKAAEILDEHFEAWVAILLCDTHEEKRCHSHVHWHGGYFNARGLLDEGLDTMRQADADLHE